MADKMFENNQVSIIGVMGVGIFWISARPFSLYFSFVLFIISSRVDPLRPLEFHVAI